MAPIKDSVIDAAIVAKLLPKKDTLPAKLKIKKPVAKPPRAEPEAPLSPESPVLNHIDIQLRSTFESGRPMEDLSHLIQCKHCKKPMLQSVAHAHIKVCLQKKNERAQKKKEQKEANRKAREAREKAEKAGRDDDDSDDESVAGGSTAKKRKAGDDGAQPKKKTKKEIEAAKPKTAKAKGPVDVERQCGVLLPNGAMCARSLTCKSHAMGAKRAVPGRSLPYDMLLAAYQKKNQAKQQKAAMDANAPLPDDAADAQGPVDSDEEKDLVLAAIARSRPKPLDQHIFVPLRRRYAYLRVKDMLSTALGGGRGGIFGGAAGGAAAALMAGAVNTGGSGGDAGNGSTSAAGTAQSDAARRTSIALQGHGQAGGSKGQGSNTGEGMNGVRKPSAANMRTAVAT